MPGEVSFLVLKLPRTGSTMLAGVLASHPEVSCAGEFLNDHQALSRRGKVKALSDFYRRRPGPPVTAHGQTMNPFKYELEARDLERALGLRARLRPGRRPDDEVRLVVLRRENLLKQAISDHVARHAVQWASSRDEIEDERLLEARAIPVPELTARVQHLAERSRRLGELAAALPAPALHLSYEDLQADPRATVTAAFELLGVSAPGPAFDFAAGYRKILSDDLRDVVANLDELARAPELAPYL